MLKSNKLSMLHKGEIKPEGWLRQQLVIQAKGLSGNLDKIWPDIRDSKWIGGNADGWERVPYWLDGFIPLSYLLDDEDLKQRAKKYIDAIVSRQEEDGWICPCEYDERRSYDMWSCILIAKVLAMYVDFSGEEAVEEALYKLLKNLWVFTRKCTIHNWASMRWFEALIPIFWMYERRPEEWLIRLARRLEQQGFNYNSLFTPFRDRKPERIWTYSTHVVNLAMAIKQGALMSRIDSKEEQDTYAETMLKELFEHHGTAINHFTGDECLMGDSPIQGSELCGVVEAMYSYEWLLSISGNPKWGDFLEKLAFNALPATLSADMWTHQYDQMVNQIKCEKLPEDHVIFGTNGPESHLFGLEPNFGCCTANFNQGWPKFAMSLFMRSDKGLVSTVLAPGSVAIKIKESNVKCRLETEYPFNNKLKYIINVDKPVDFEFSIRIPSSAKRAKVSGKEARVGEFFKIEKNWDGEEIIEVELEHESKIVKRPRNMGVLWHGPLLYSVAIKERWEKREYIRDGVERKYPYCDYEVFPESEWNYGFYGHEFTFKQKNMGEFPFANNQAPNEIIAKLVPLEWKEVHGVCTLEPESRIPLSDPVEVRMIPYGCARLRMTEMPIIK